MAADSSESIRAGDGSAAGFARFRLHGQVQGRRAADVPPDGDRGLPPPDEPGRLPGGAAEERRDGPQDQHLLALLLPRQLHHPLAARRRGAGDAAGRLCARADPRLPQPHGRDRRPPGRAREQADRRDPRPRPAQRPPLRRRGVDPRPRRGGLARRRVPVPERGLSRRLLDPQALHRREHPAPADGQDPRLHHHHRRDEERLRRPAQRAPPLDASGDPPDAGRSADDPEEDPLRNLRRDGRHLRRRRPRAALHDPAREERAARERRPGGDRRRPRRS